jgi:hypothetical protein
MVRLKGFWVGLSGRHHTRRPENGSCDKRRYTGAHRLAETKGHTVKSILSKYNFKLGLWCKDLLKET